MLIFASMPLLLRRCRQPTLLLLMPPRCSIYTTAIFAALIRHDCRYAAAAAAFRRCATDADISIYHTAVCYVVTMSRYQSYEMYRLSHNTLRIPAQSICRCCFRLMPLLLAAYFSAIRRRLRFFATLLTPLLLLHTLSMLIFIVFLMLDAPC